MKHTCIPLSQSAFVVQLPGSYTSIADTSISYNLIDMPWIGASALEEAQLDISDFFMEENENLSVRQQ